MNGVLEMDGFKDTFRYLYGYNGTTQEANFSNISTNDVGGVCSSGNGAGLDVVIVSYGVFRSLDRTGMEWTG